MTHKFVRLINSKIQVFLFRVMGTFVGQLGRLFSLVVTSSAASAKLFYRMD